MLYSLILLFFFLVFLLPGKKSAMYLMNSECKESSVGGKPSPSGLPLPPKNIKDLQTTPGYENVDIFTYQEMKLATKQFRPDYILGEGGFGVVYKGLIDDNVRPGYNSTKVAIKELNPEGFQGDREWLVFIIGLFFCFLDLRICGLILSIFFVFFFLQAEVNYLGQLSHPNLVKLIGYCCEDEHRLLVYEYMSLGSLEKHLFRSKFSPPFKTLTLLEGQVWVS